MDDSLWLLLLFVFGGLLLIAADRNTDPNRS
jgi:hypothetical protein